MSIEQLAETAQAMVAPGKGIIAIDESTGTIAKRFASVGIENTEENRRAYRELLLTTPKLSDYISGAILFDETIRQSTKDGVPFAKYMSDHGIIPGIKVDKGTHPLAGCPGEVEAHSGLVLHHQVRHVDSQWRIFREITCDQVRLSDPATAPAELARVLRSCREYSQPVLIEVPRDMTLHPMAEVPLLPPSPFNEAAVAECADEWMARIQAAQRPVLVVDVEVREVRDADAVPPAGAVATETIRSCARLTRYR